MSKRKTERLLGLVVCLLSTRRYLTADQIRQAVPGYPEQDDLFKRMFERDKEDLRELGVPLETGLNHVFDDDPGYRIRQQAYELPELRLEADEDPFAVRCDDDKVWDERPCLFLTFSNSKYTGGAMLIAPQADPTDGLIEFVRWGPIGRLGLMRTLPRLYDGTHINHPLASRRAVRHVEFNVPSPVDVMIDGEVATLQCRSLDVIPSALDVYI
jgi:hypothetical protein